jgi:hypothetical protein
MFIVYFFAISGPMSLFLAIIIDVLVAIPIMFGA